MTSFSLMSYDNRDTPNKSRKRPETEANDQKISEKEVNDQKKVKKREKGLFAELFEILFLARPGGFSFPCFLNRRRN